jgi:hypothetical protein
MIQAGIQMDLRTADAAPDGAWESIFSTTNIIYHPF